MNPQPNTTMTRLLTHRVNRLAAMLALACGSAFGSNPDAISLGKFYSFDQQTGQTTVSPSGGFVLATVSFPTQTTGVSASVRKPDGTSVALTAQGDDFVYDSQQFASPEALTAAWPDGVYKVILSGSQTGEYSIRLSGVRAPVAPRLLNLPSSGSVANGTNVRLNFEPMQSPSQNDAVLVTMNRLQGGFRWTSAPLGQPGAIPASAAEVTLPALPSDSELRGSVAFGRAAEEFTANGGTTVVSAGVAAVTRFVLATGNGGSGADVFAGETQLTAGSSWRSTEWFGTYYRDASVWPWIYHSDLGWMYVHPGTNGGIFLWQPSTGWFYTKATYYPYLYSYQRAGWVYYQKGSKNPRWFYDPKPGVGWFRWN